ncbi:MAG: helix-turn-helix domain-containing protein [Nanoarchaeota archaeon]|nr:helix-turn-helix domain-containing protein [Nanoarchaeota archaeon]
MDTSVLENIGLSRIEIKVFIAVLELGESKAGKIIEKSGLQSSSVYDAINKLISKGLLSYIKKSQVKYYKAPDPEVILDYIELKKGEYIKILPELKARQKKTENEGVEFFKSFKGIKTIMSELIKDAKKGDIYRTFSVENPEDYKLARENVFRYTKQLFREKKIIVKGIFHKQNRYSPTKSSITQKRYISFPLPPNTMVLNDKVAIISWKEEPTGILIKSKDIADKYISFFDAMWKIAKK